MFLTSYLPNVTLFSMVKTKAHSSNKKEVEAESQLKKISDLKHLRQSVVKVDASNDHSIRLAL
jgi:hypothetical protein